MELADSITLCVGLASADTLIWSVLDDGGQFFKNFLNVDYANPGESSIGGGDDGYYWEVVCDLGTA